MADITAVAARRYLRIALLLLLFGAGIVLTGQQAYAYPPAGADTVQVTVSLSLTSRLGQESIIFAGIVTIARSDPYVDAGVEVVDLEVTSLALAGNSLTGPVTITQSASFPSIGEIRSDQPGQNWPASAYLDIFVDVAAPASPSSTITKHNEVAIRVAPMYRDLPLPISSWPPLTVPWEAGLATCVSLLPTVPKDVCVTGLSLVMSAPTSGEEVGGLSELSRIGAADAGNAWVARSYVLAASLAAAAAAVFGFAWFARRRLIR